MKNTIYFLSRNWFRLLTSISMLLFSAGFFIQSISPVYSKPDFSKTEFNSSGKYNYWVVSWNGYAYIFQSCDGSSPVFQRKTKL